MNNSKPYYYIIKDYNIDKVGLLFFSKKNVNLIQETIKQLIKEFLNVELIRDQRVESLLMVMRNIYLQDGRHLEYKINEQLEDLNLKLLNTLIPDIITGVKQQLAYNEYINKPLDPLDRPKSETLKGSKMPKAVSSLWGF